MVVGLRVCFFCGIGLGYSFPIHPLIWCMGFKILAFKVGAFRST